MSKALQAFLDSPQGNTLKYPPRYENGILVCYRCGTATSKLRVHHNNSTGEPIAIICPGCNVAVKNSSLITRCEPIKKGMPMLKTSVGLSPQNVKWCKSRHINVSDLVDALMAEYRVALDTQGSFTTVKEVVRRALARELSNENGPTMKLLPPESNKEESEDA